MIDRTAPLSYADIEKQYDSIDKALSDLDKAKAALQKIMDLKPQQQIYPDSPRVDWKNPTLEDVHNIARKTLEEIA